MAFDDDDTTSVMGPAANTAPPEDADEDAPDYKLFLSMFDKAGVSSKAIRKGEKDFESHGTRAQDNLLEASRNVMDNVLSYTRIHREEAWVRGWCFPDWWADLEQAGEQEGLWLRDRVVAMEHERGNWQKDIGRAVPAKIERAGAGRLWLLPEEAIYLIERGTVDLWWPNRTLEELLPKAEAVGEAGLDLGPDNYDIGLPLSLEAAYSLFVGHDGERGKISLPKYHVFSHLKRAGFHVLRAPPQPQILSPTPPTKTLWEWLFSLIGQGQDARPRQQPSEPLIQPGLYRAYRPIYQKLAILPRHKPLPTPAEVQTPDEPFRVFFHVWKTGGVPFSKKAPPPPDFRIAVVDASESCVPSLEQIEALLESTPYDPPNKAAWQGPGRMYQRLKHGHRNVLVAIVDRGLVNFMRFGEGAFGEERLFERFDNRGGPRAGKKGGRGGGRGRGRGRGRGGRGRGRGG